MHASVRLTVILGAFVLLAGAIACGDGGAQVSEVEGRGAAAGAQPDVRADATALQASGPGSGIWVTGQASVNVEPDLVLLTVGVETTGETVAGLRWTIEECFQRAKDDLGLDHCEARSWHGWHRHISLVMAAAAFLAKLAADLRNAASGKENETSPNPPIAA